ncbi:carbamoyltransferase C-terminal domain-containing protein [Campylobacter hyointestinalis]|uniref:carbamoyltransferase C-terminal domain-containing protein n=1 Tax=Campylobacter hyointestinalis TaxID=198 RepID=UPI001CA4E707|nr:carbamoyltransferase C-terminal domain-containing protein [Campylobacter hyointestinalis]
MNIKAMGKISYLPEVQDIFIGGSASDESMAISAGICAVEDKDVEFNPIKMYPKQKLYLGQEASLYEEQVAIENLDSSYTIIDKFNAKDIATLLANSAILARCAGRMEFGQRALGNRSILADPSNLRVRDTINDMIKNRDFWMPFAPIVMDKYMDIYLQNPKKIFSPYMTIGFDTTSIGYEAMIAACHPADKSARPQMLTKDLNQNLYMILEEFEKIRGIGALLNTSFNLHGYPIVNTPSQAIYVLKNSGLDGLILNNFIVLKK